MVGSFSAARAPSLESSTEGLLEHEAVSGAEGSRPRVEGSGREVIASAEALVGTSPLGAYDVCELSAAGASLVGGPALSLGTKLELLVTCAQRISFAVRAEVVAVDPGSSALRVSFGSLPKALAAAMPRIVELARSVDASGPRTVLVVDDCPAAGRAIARDLRRMGLTVLTAATPLEAVQCIEASDAPILAAIVDFHLAGAYGTEVLDFLRSEHPDVRRIFFSGDEAACAAERAEHGTRSQGVLAKPWTTAALEHVLGAPQLATSER